MQIRGVYPPIPTPFKEDGSLVLDRLAENLARWNETGLAGYVVLGSNGESVHIKAEEREDLIRAAREAIPKDRLLIVGTGCHSTAETIEQTTQAAEGGADAVLVLPPHYYKGQMTSQVLARHYTTLAEAAEVPILFYDMPRFTGVELPTGLVVELAHDPNIVGIKDSGGNLSKMAEIIHRAPSDFSVLAGSGGFFYPALALGATGGVLAVANLLPEQCCQIYQAVQEGRHLEAQRLQLKLVALNQAVTAGYGVPGLKAALDMIGYYGGPPRLPLAYPQGEQLSEIRRLLVETGFFQASDISS